MNHDYKKRGYLLPKGCKDLVDVLKPKVGHQEVSSIRTIPLPPITGEITVAQVMTVRELAQALKQKPFKIIADLMKLFGESVGVHHMLYLPQIEQVVLLYGFTAKFVF